MNINDIKNLKNIGIFLYNNKLKEIILHSPKFTLHKKYFISLYK